MTKSPMASLRKALHGNPLAAQVVFMAQNLVNSVMLADPHAIQPPEKQWFLAAMVRVKDEARFLPEWLAYHRLVGVEHVYVYDNGSADNIGEVLAPFVEQGFATHIPWPVRPASPSADKHFLSQYAGNAEWVALIDADEFIVEGAEGALLRMLASHPALSALALNWRYFGSSGHVALPDGLVIENFRSADRRLDKHVKVVARTSAIRRYRNSHSRYYAWGHLARGIDLRRVYGSFHRVRSNEAPVLVLNHYVYRSQDDYVRKAARGYVDARGEADQSRALESAIIEFDRHNEAEFPVPGDLGRRTRELLQELGFSQEYTG